MRSGGHTTYTFAQKFLDKLHLSQYFRSFHLRCKTAALKKNSKWTVASFVVRRFCNGQLFFPPSVRCFHFHCRHFLVVCIIFSCARSSALSFIVVWFRFVLCSDSSTVFRYGCCYQTWIMVLLSCRCEFHCMNYITKTNFKRNLWCSQSQCLHFDVIRPKCKKHLDGCFFGMLQLKTQPPPTQRNKNNLSTKRFRGFCC